MLPLRLFKVQIYLVRAATWKALAQEDKLEKAECWVGFGLFFLTHDLLSLCKPVFLRKVLLAYFGVLITYF